jgi:acrylyl-CoA reductase (NADPH)
MVIDKADAGQSVGLRSFDEGDLMDGDVTVRVTHSTLNYKDGLALTGKAPVVRRFPMIPGVDLVGTVEASSNPEFKPGDAVILNGWGLGETHLGAYAERARVRGEWLIPLPQGPRAPAGHGHRHGGLYGDALPHGPGAARPAPGPGPRRRHGGGGRRRLRGRGAPRGGRVARGRLHGAAGEADYLKGLGAAEILDRSELSGSVRPLAKERWAAGVDTVGSTILANVLSMTGYGGAVAACGLAAGMDLPTTVAPFILRGVSLLGVDSVAAPKALRLEAWDRLARELDHDKLAAMTSTIPLDRVMEAGREIVAGRIKGRVVVEIG